VNIVVNVLTTNFLGTKCLQPNGKLDTNHPLKTFTNEKGSQSRCFDSNNGAVLNFFSRTGMRVVVSWMIKGKAVITVDLVMFGPVCEPTMHH
jgi:hypothetical protein